MANLPNEQQTQPNTTALRHWISQIKTKKRTFKRKVHKSLRVDAVLTHALSVAQHELREKQQIRRLKWRSLEPLFAEKLSNKVDVCDEDIDRGLDSFMSKLKNVKPTLR